jgi:uncharacterized protein YrrD
MRKVSELVGQPIVSAASGERVGKVSDVLLDAETRHVVGLVVAGGLFTSEQVLPYKNVQTLGKDAVIARSTTGVVGPKGWREQAAAATRSSTLNHKRVLTTSGRALGEVHDVFLDDAGTVEAFEITGGGLMRRRSILPRAGGVTVGSDALLVSDETAAAMEGRS